MLGQDVTPGGLGRALAVSVGGVEEVDTSIKRRFGAGSRLLGRHAPGEGEPGAESDLGHLQVRASQLAIPHDGCPPWLS
jgi:hypothetical protein